ncbi:hypothetical protein BFV94_0494 [Alteromonas macleodii]|uniref:Transposase n=1 Tax=Alteromonas macleodii TaxID=28108 RepID=A0AB36FUA5_ALTMA|nr:hypothetical protein BFV95_0490 [Alteromonas macleodii]OES35099.1 hypothetical protein BFV94_0494 [Alteromonas macleodii]OES36744.1 hypothetical protein BFV93_0493 [Alteromonas macleodii]OES41983.1 hypothetical protein BFV96_0492 [Alteromonas macleodii]
MQRLHRRNTLFTGVLKVVKANLPSAIYRTALTFHLAVTYCVVNV